jgi:histidyl-tRNA synthetase
MGLERIYSLMKDDHLLDSLENGIDLYVMPVGEEVLDDVFALTEECRGLGYSCETPLSALKMGAMFKRAEKKNAKFALIMGEDELQKGEAQLKNLKTKEQVTIKLDHLEDELDKAFGENEEHHHHDGE